MRSDVFQDSFLDQFSIGDRLNVDFEGGTVTAIVITTHRTLMPPDRPNRYTVYIEEEDGQRWCLVTYEEEDEVKLQFAVGESSGDRPALDSVEWETKGVVDSIGFIENAKDDSRVPSRFK